LKREIVASKKHAPSFRRRLMRHRRRRRRRRRKLRSERGEEIGSPAFDFQTDFNL
jgi:hypothetical protein